LLSWVACLAILQRYVRSSFLLHFSDISFLPVKDIPPRMCNIRLLLRSHRQRLLA